MTTTDPRSADALAQGYAYVDLGEEFRRRHAEAFPAVTPPRITFGRITEADGRCTMPLSIHAHHALADGLHVAQFVDKFQHSLDTPDSGPS